MIDKELLELAAKAAGIELCFGFETGRFYVAGTAEVWNPLTDDGDALKLAVKLGMELSIELPEVVSPATVWAMAEECNGAGSSEYIEKDPYAATRRAIVRAAAEIGRTAESEKK